MTYVIGFAAGMVGIALVVATLASIMKSIQVVGDFVGFIF
jgi:hypothetical protein